MIRCAIYTRKSSDERLDAEYSSLDNQRAYCAAYIASQGGNGWVELVEQYDDGGWSGGNLKRPALARLRADIAAGKLDMVVVYKIDRLSRSLKDFVNLVEEFEAAGTAFVSVTQSFDTSTSMGRLMLNVLLSFAQFERELTGERLRDWFAGARARGLWTQQRPFGYRKRDGNHLEPEPAEAETVRWIFRRYVALKSAERVADELYTRGVRNTRGRPWSGTMIRHMIAHPIYRGQLVHRREQVPGMHEPIVSDRLWQRANSVLDEARKHRMRGAGQKPIGILRGLLHDRNGDRLVHTFVTSRGKLYRYYIAQQEQRHGYGDGSDPYMRFRADELEASVIDVVARMTGTTFEPLVDQRSRMERIRRHVARIDLSPTEMRLTFTAGAVVSAEAGGRLGQRTRRARPTRQRPWIIEQLAEEK